MELDSSYSFYSIALDSAGNKETSPSSADATTLINLITGLSDEFLDANCRIFPNPNSGSFSISFLNPRKESIDVSVINTYGALIKSEMFKPAGSKQIKQMSLPHNYKGIYFLKIKIGNSVLYKKVMVDY